MASKGKLIKEINSKEDFETAITSDTKLLIVDCFDEWYGPCSQMEPTFKTLASNTDFWDNRGQLMQMELKVVPELEEKYSELKPKSKALFLFYKGGKIVGEVFGCDAPEILRAIADNLPEWKPEEE